MVEQSLHASEDGQPILSFHVALERKHFLVITIFLYFSCCLGSDPNFFSSHLGTGWCTHAYFKNMVDSQNNPPQSLSVVTPANGQTETNSIHETRVNGGPPTSILEDVELGRR